MVTSSNTVTVTVAGKTSGGSLRHIGILWLENQDLAEVNAHSTELPALAKQYATTSNYHAVDHPSWPNYSACIAGSFFGISSDPEPPSSKQLNDTTIVSLISKGGLTWKEYAQSYPGSCFLGGPIQPYVGHHVPFLYFTEITKVASQCAQVVNFDAFATDVSGGSLPELFFITPDNDHNYTNQDWATGDAFVKGVVQALESLPEWDQTGLFIVFDEPVKGTVDQPLTDPVYMTFVSPLAKMGATSTKYYDHYSLLATLEAAIGQGNLGRNDATATVLSDLFASGAVPRF